MAVTSLPIFFLMMVPMFFMIPQVDHAGNPTDFGWPFGMFFFMPIIYLVFTYIFVALGCWIYNIFFTLIGGFEFEFYEEG